MVSSARIKTSDYKDLIVYQKSLINSLNLFRHYKSQKPLWLERFLIQQLLRAITSVGANIVEGYGRGSRADYKRFLRIAKGSSLETEYWINIIIEVRPQDKQLLEQARLINIEVLKMLTAMLRNLKI